MPEEFRDRKWDYSKFSRGERFVYKTIPKAEFDEILAQVERWGLDQYLQQRGYNELARPAA